MSSVIENIAVDCAAPFALAQFWSRVLDRPLLHGASADDDEVAVILQAGTTLLIFIAVPEPKSVKNRLHLCLRPNGSQEAEVERIISLGASLYDDRRRADGSGWAVLADPEGNEFCVLSRKSAVVPD